MRQGTTPTLTLSIDAGVDLTQLTGIYVTIDQDGVQVTKALGDSGFTVEPTRVAVTLTQEDTLGFRPGTAKVQLRGIDISGSVFATDIVSVAVRPALLKKVIRPATSG